MNKRHRLHIALLLLTISVGINACKKEPPVVTTPAEESKGNAKAVIVNKIQDSVYIVLSGHDIATGTLPHILYLVLPPSDTMVIPKADLKNAYRYQYDWHTADYTYSNWFMTDTEGKALQLQFDYYTDTTDYILQVNGVRRNDILICLDGDGLSSTWTAVNAYDSVGSSVWAALTDREKSHSFIISKFHTSKHFYTDTANQQKISNLAFAMDISQPRLWLSIRQPLDSYMLCNDLQPMLPLATQAKDTLYYSRCTTDSTGKVRYPQPYYVLVRQSVEK